MLARTFTALQTGTLRVTFVIAVAAAWRETATRRRRDEIRYADVLDVRGRLARHGRGLHPAARCAEGDVRWDRPELELGRVGLEEELEQRGVEIELLPSRGPVGVLEELEQRRVQPLLRRRARARGAPVRAPGALRVAV